MRFKCLFSLLLVFHCAAQEIEVRLETASHVKPLYMARFHSDSEGEGAYLEGLRKAFVFDIDQGGFASTLPIEESLEIAFQQPSLRQQFNLMAWRRKQVDFVVAAWKQEGVLTITVFDVHKGSSKEYVSPPLTGRLGEDRKAIHHISDAIHKDLFGSEGIASLRIVYSQRVYEEGKKRSDWCSQIWIQDFDGANAKQATFENSYCITPSFYPHTAGMAHPPFVFVSFKGGQSKIYRASSQHRSEEPLIALRGNQLLPALHPKGNQMAFIADVAGRADLFLQPFDGQGNPVGKARQIYSRARATHASPTFHPGGKQIAFVSDQDGPPRIYSIDLVAPEKGQKARPRLLTQKHRENTCPAWSPDGKKLAYSAKVEGVRQIWIYDAETGEESPLTQGPLNKENPAWAPDSLHLVYNTDDNEEGQLFLINLHQRLPVQISSAEGQNRFASWETR